MAPRLFRFGRAARAEAYKQLVFRAATVQFPALVNPIESAYRVIEFLFVTQSLAQPLSEFNQNDPDAGREFEAIVVRQIVNALAQRIVEHGKRVVAVDE